jgi:hypothetical protein
VKGEVCEFAARRAEQDANENTSQLALGEVPQVGERKVLSIGERGLLQEALKVQQADIESIIRIQPCMAIVDYKPVFGLSVVKRHARSELKIRDESVENPLATSTRLS